MEIKSKKLIPVNYAGDVLMYAKYNTEFAYQLNYQIGQLQVQKRLLHLPEAHFTFSLYTISDFRKMGFLIDPEIEKWEIQEKERLRLMTEEPISGIKGELFPYQKEGVAFIEEHQGNVLLSHEPGLGKTLMSIAYLQRHLTKRPVVIVCPASLKLNWQRELKMWMPEPKEQVISGTKIVPVTGEIIIINYDILNSWIEPLKKLKPQILILDEVHAIKNNDATRTKAVKKLAKGIPHTIAISGTPILNRPAEIYNAVKIVAPSLFPDHKKFLKRYCDLRYNGFGWESNGASHVPELHKILTENIMIRRLKKDVLKDLPDKLFSFVPIDIDNRTDYLSAESDLVEWIHQLKGAEAAMKAKSAESFVKTETLKQLAVQGKMNGIKNWISDFLETDNKLVVFANHAFVIDELMTKFKDVAVKIDGSTSLKNRDINVQKFQGDERIKLFVGNIQAAGVGLTLTASSNVAFIEYPWSPGLLVQAADRCHRLGQKDNVTVHYLLANDTIEEHIARILDRKRKVLDATLDGIESEKQSLIMELMKMYEAKK